MRSGTALVELIVAMTVGALLMTAGIASLDQLVRARSLEDERELAALTARAAMSDWLRSAREGTGTPFQALDRTMMGMSTDEVSFTTASARPWIAGETHVRFRIESDPLAGEQGLVAELESVHARGVRRVLLIQRATGFDIRYRSSGSGSEWQTVWNSPAELPRAVELTIQFDQGAAERSLQRLPLVVRLEGAK